MTSAESGDILMEADLSGAGVFIRVGTLLKPTLALNTAVAELRRERKQGEWHDVLLYIVAARIAGECAIADDAMAQSLNDVLASSVVLEWRITIPELGSVRALFSLATLEETANAESFRVALRLAGHPVMEPFYCENRC